MPISRHGNRPEETQGNHLESTYRLVCGKSQGDESRAGGGRDLAREFEEQVERLAALPKASNGCLEKPFASGQEHEVFEAEDPDFIYRLTLHGTFGVLLRAGMRIDKVTQAYVTFLHLTTATPAEYLRRLTLQNDVFGNVFEFVGIHYGTHGAAIVTSHPYIAGGPATDDEIAQFMEALAFRRVPEEHVQNDTMNAFTWYRATDAVLITDAAPRNFKKTGDGHIIPIDLVVQHWPGLDERLGFFGAQFSS